MYNNNDSVNQTEHEEVAEVAVVGYPHEVKGEGVFAFMVLKEGTHSSTEKITADLKKLVRSQIAAYAVPDVFLVSTYKVLYCTVFLAVLPDR